MTAIALSGFTGEIPKVTPRLLPTMASQRASAVRLNDGALTPMRQPGLVETLPADAQTIYKFAGNFIYWNADVDVAAGPTTDLPYYVDGPFQRIYFTGDGRPKVTISNIDTPEQDTYDIAMPVPPAPSALAVLPDGTADPATQFSVVYSISWITVYGEESELSPLSPEVVVDATEDRVNLVIGTSTGGVYVDLPPDRAIYGYRLYRSITSNTGGISSTGLFLIKDEGIEWLYQDHAAQPAGDPATSKDYNSPPDGMMGIVAGPNGMMAAFLDRDVLFCEPYICHAWPEKYRLTTEFPVVSLGWYGTSLVITTQGPPYIATGTAPENMTMERLEVNLPCVSKRGTVDLGYAIAYPTVAGLALVNASGARVVTSDLFTREQWAALRPDLMLASQYEGRYVATYRYNNGASQGIMLLDMTGEQPFRIVVDDQAEAMYYDIQETNLYFLKNSRDIYGWDLASQPYATMNWDSKQFWFPGPVSFGCIQVESVNPIGGGDTGSAIVRADGNIIATIPLSQFNKIARIPAKNMHRQWEVEVEANFPLVSIVIAQVPEELVS